MPGALMLIALLFWGPVTAMVPAKLVLQRQLVRAGALLLLVSALFAVPWGLRGRREAGRRDRLIAEHPEEVWWYHYDWHPEGERKLGPEMVAHNLGWTAFMWFFLLPFNHIAFLATGPNEFSGSWVVKGGILLFDLLGLLVLAGGVGALGRWCLHGAVELRYGRFPFHPGQTVELAAALQRGTPTEVEATLRLVEAREVPAASEEETDSTVYTELYRDSYSGDPRRIRFQLPPDAPPTYLVSDEPVQRFWEVQLQLPGKLWPIDQRFLLPVYEPL